jgi:hypothetical protein
MRLSRFAPLALAAVSVLSATNDAQARYLGNFNLFVGQAWLRKGDWAPVDQQPEIGLMLAFGEERAPVHFVIDALVSKSEVSDADPLGSGRVKASSREFAIGVRKVWDQSVTRPHLGAGADIINVSEELDGPFGPVKNEDRAYGAWVDLGVSWRLASHLNLGIEARYSYAIARLGSGSLARDVTAGGIHLGLLVGYGW